MGLTAWLSSLWGNLKDIAGSIYSWVSGLLQSLSGGVNAALGRLWSILSHPIASVQRALAWFKLSNLRDLWARFKRYWDEYQKWKKKYLDQIWAPIDAIRRVIFQIYNTFFRPVIELIDTFRKLTTIIALFDEKLAAKLDARLLALEAKLLAPVTFMLNRVNAIGTYIQAIVTASGLIDRSVLVASIKRDGDLIWSVLTNPLGQTIKRPKPPEAVPLSDIVRGARQYSANRTGPWALEMDALVGEVQNNRIAMGGA